MPKKDFTIQRRGQNHYERTVVGRDGQTHVMQADREGRNGHYTDEGRVSPRHRAGGGSEQENVIPGTSSDTGGRRE